MSGRPPTSMRTRLGTSSNRPPGTAARPMTRGGQGYGNNIFGGINVADRPMTQQGLGGMKTAGRGQRQVQDRTYWLGEVRGKCSELTSEIRKVETEIVQRQEENNTYLMFEKRAEALTAELSDLQGQLHDYNLMIDRINTNRDISDMVEDLNALKVQNEQESEILEKIFVEKQKAEKEIENLDKKLHRHQMLTENRVQDMNPKMRSKYSSLKQESLQRMEALTSLQTELEDLTTKHDDLETQVQHDVMKLEALKLHEKFGELTEKEEQLKAEQKIHMTPEEEQQKLLASVKADNQEISTMDRQNKELDERIRMMQEEVTQIENELEDQQSESTDKFRQLQRREMTMDEFMDSFDQTKEQQQQEQFQLEGAIVALLEQIAKTIEFGQNVPSADRMKALKDDLQFKEGELHKAESTSNALIGQSSKLQEDLSKVEELEVKIESERQAMTKDIEKMEAEMEVYKNVNQLRAEAETIKAELKQEKEQLEKSKMGQRERLERIDKQYNSLVGELEENETHVQLLNLERKWQHIEQNNFAMKEFIFSRSVDCKPIKSQVLKLVSGNNKLLQDLYTKSSLLN